MLRRQSGDGAGRGFTGDTAVMCSTTSVATSLKVSKPSPPVYFRLGDQCGGYIDETPDNEDLPMEEVPPRLDAEALERIKEYLSTRAGFVIEDDFLDDLASDDRQVAKEHQAASAMAQESQAASARQASARLGGA